MKPVRAIKHVPDHEGFVEEDVCLHYLILLDRELDSGRWTRARSLPLSAFSATVDYMLNVINNFFR